MQPSTNSEYQIPGGHERIEDAPVPSVDQVEDAVNAYTVSTETLDQMYARVEQREVLAPPYTFVKEIERDLEEMRREHEVATEAAKKLSAKIISKAMTVAAKAQLITLAPNNHEAKLVNKESVLGGEVLPTVEGAQWQKLWYHKGDWFYGIQDEKGAMYARYQFSHHTVDKIVGGLAVPFAPGESENLMGLVPKYHAKVSEDLYGKSTKPRIDVAE